MNASIGVYETHEQAIAAVETLKEAGYPVSQLTIMGLLETEAVDKQMHILPKNTMKLGGVEVGSVLGTAVGLLTGVGIFAIPGVGFLFGAGALIGAIAGFDIGLLGGGIVSALVSAGVKDEMAKKYHDDLVAGKFLVIAHGKQGDVDKASALLQEHGTHTELDMH